MDPAERLDKLERALLSGAIDRQQFLDGAAETGLLTPSAAEDLSSDLEAIRAAQTDAKKRLQSDYDYIVVGTGSAGCALVGSLATARPDASILVLEAGGWDLDPAVRDPRLWFTNLGTSREWGDVSLGSDGVNGRAIPEHTGRLVGGGSSINATIWARPFKADLDHWAEVSGDERWSYDHCLEIFKRIENWQGTPDPRTRGTSGPVWVQPSADSLPLVEATLRAIKEAGLPVVDDLNGEREVTGNGFALMNQIIKDGRRHSMARAFLYPALAQSNVTLLTDTHANRVVITDGRATAVECVSDGTVRTYRARSEIVLSTGAFNTPKLLMLSGIGDETALRELGIDVVVHAPEVGKNVQDHILHGGCLYEAPEPFEYRNSAANVSGYLKTDPASELPDVSLVQIEIPYASDVVAQRYAPPPTTWALCAGLVAPKSRGTVTLRSSDPADRPIVDMQFLSHPEDVEALKRSIRIARDVARSGPLSDFVVREVAPGREMSDEELTTFVRDGATTYFHAAGACRMGSDDHAVVDAELRVRGVSGLRIADSTIMPRIVAVPTMSACVLIGIRLADLLG
ncbi:MULTISPECIES: GMC family oxidoreductase [unclassified Aeromicrobium]|uniref:GMC family oxidoreductase n=1 Tax=unclassified Aeromicrobium TaxID=2633570 RepID=UPI00396B31D0